MGLIARLLGKRALVAPGLVFSKVMRSNAQSWILQDICRLRAGLAGIGPGLASDPDDLSALHFTAHGNDGALAGAARLARAGASDDFPFERSCTVSQLTRPPAGEAAELSHLVLAPSARDRQAALLGLVRDMLRYSRASGVRFWYTTLDAGLLRALEAAGLTFVTIGTPLGRDGVLTPQMTDLHAYARRLREHDPLLAAWLHDETIGIKILLKAFLAEPRRGGH
jgi:hypothetical protein